MKTKWKWVACWWHHDDECWVPGDHIKMTKQACRDFIEDQRLDGCDAKWMICRVKLEEGEVIE